MTHFIECKRDGGGRVRIHIDSIGGVIETTKAEKTNLSVILNFGAQFNLAEETMDSLFNKIAQCPGGNRVVISEPVYEGMMPHPDESRDTDR